jgi:hypothetical protein
MTFTTELNARSCTPLTNCVGGEYVSAEPTPASDRVCTACPADPLPSALAGTGVDGSGGSGDIGSSGSGTVLSFLPEELNRALVFSAMTALEDVIVALEDVVGIHDVAWVEARPHV